MGRADECTRHIGELGNCGRNPVQTGVARRRALIALLPAVRGRARRLGRSGGQRPATTAPSTGVAIPRGDLQGCRGRLRPATFGSPRARGPRSHSPGLTQPDRCPLRDRRPGLRGGEERPHQGVRQPRGPDATIVRRPRDRSNDYWDRGLLGLELDPDFPATPYMYVLYTLRRASGGPAPAGTTTARRRRGPPRDGCVVRAALSRLTPAGDVMTGADRCSSRTGASSTPATPSATSASAPTASCT